MLPDDVNPDNALHAELNEHLDAAARHEKRVEEAAEYAKSLLEKGQECDPWTFEHFEEAMTNAPEGGRRIVWNYIQEAALSEKNKPTNSVMAIELLKHLVMTYWEHIASIEAGKQFANR